MAPRKAAATPVATKVASTPASVNWDALPEAEVVTYERATVATVDREATTPEPIKARVVTAHGVSQRAGEAKYFNQACGSADAATEFLSLARAYATSKGWTLRGTVVSDSTLNKLVQDKRVAPGIATGSLVTYSVKDKETRTRLQDSTKELIAKILRKQPTHDTVKELANTHMVSVQTVRKIATDNGIKLPELKRGRKAAASK